MKRIFGAFLCLIFVLLLLSACTKNTEVSREAVDRRYTAASDSKETRYQYIYCGNGVIVPVPHVRIVHRDAEYEILYRILYDDDSAVTRWEHVSEAEYERFTP